VQNSKHLLSLLDINSLSSLCEIVPDNWQSELLQSNDDRIIINASRQAGKSLVVCLLALSTVFQPNTLTLLVSRSLRQAQELFICLKGLYIKAPLVDCKSETTLSLCLKNGSRVLCLPSSPDTIRCYSAVDLLIIDEASRVLDEVYLATRPMLAVSKGRLLLLSTPAGLRGFFSDVWHTGENWKKYEITAEECPRITPEFLSEERKAMSERFYKQEYMCQFSSTDDSLFSNELIENSLTDEIEIYTPGGTEG